MRINKLKGFTLIELLVVISIIGMLSSVILVALNVARNKGATASTIEFTDHNYHKLGVNTLVSLNFNEVDGVAPVDSTGNFVFTSPSGLNLHSSDTPFGDGGESFIADLNSANINAQNPVSGIGTGINLPDQSGVTFSLWEKGVLTSATIMLQLGFNINTILFNFKQDMSNNGYCGPLAGTNNIPTIANDSNWHNVTCTYDGKNVYVYYDGKLLSSPYPYVATLTNLSRVKLNNAPGNFSGLLDNFQVFSGSLLASDVQKLYAEGLKAHQFAQK